MIESIAIIIVSLMFVISFIAVISGYHFNSNLTCNGKPYDHHMWSDWEAAAQGSLAQGTLFRICDSCAAVEFRD